eukprot:761716-Hanusia_phi.AAC.1
MMVVMDQDDWGGELTAIDEIASTCIICYKKDKTSFWNHLSLQVKDEVLLAWRAAVLRGDAGGWRGRGRGRRGGGEMGGEEEVETGEEAEEVRLARPSESSSVHEHRARATARRSQPCVAGGDCISTEVCLRKNANEVEISDEAP